MKKILVFPILLTLAACSSAPVQTDSVMTLDDSIVIDSPKPSKSSEKMAKQSEEIIIPPQASSVAPVKSLYSNLNDAVRSQSDEKMYQAASLILFTNPNDLKALNVMGMYQYKKSRFELAEFMVRKAIKANSTVGELYNNLGIILLAKNERREAILAFRKALELNSDDGVAAANVGAIYVTERDYAKANIVLDTAIRRGIRDPKVLNNYGIALSAVGKNSKAEGIFRDILKSQPNDREVLLNLAVLLIDGMGKNSEGIELINRLKFVGGPAESRSRINALENKAKAGLK